MSAGVDLVITTYNRRELARRAVANALEQDCPGLRVTVVDDGGSDGTTEALRGGFGDRIRVIRQANAGLSAARNRGIAETSSKYVAFLDDDDLLLPGKLRRQRDLLEADPSLGFCYSSGFMIKSWRPDAERIVGGPRGEVFSDLLRQNAGPPLAYMVRRDLLGKTGTFDESLTSVEDWDLWLRCARVACCGYDPEPGYRYFLFAENMSRNHENMLRHMLLVFDRYVDDWDAPAALKREYRARHQVKFVRRFFDDGRPDRAVDVFREAWLATTLSARLLPARYLSAYLRRDGRWFAANVGRAIRSDARSRAAAVGNLVRAAARQARAGDVAGARTIVCSLAPRGASRMLPPGEYESTGPA